MRYQLAPWSGVCALQHTRPPGPNEVMRLQLMKGRMGLPPRPGLPLWGRSTVVCWTMLLCLRLCREHRDPGSPVICPPEDQMSTELQWESTINDKIKEHDIIRQNGPHPSDGPLSSIASHQMSPLSGLSSIVQAMSVTIHLE